MIEINKDGRSLPLFHKRGINNIWGVSFWYHADRPKSSIKLGGLASSEWVLNPLYRSPARQICFSLSVEDPLNEFIRRIIG